MLTQLSTLKSRLNIISTTDDALLTRMINAVSTRFEHFCNREFGRQSYSDEFSAESTEVVVSCYPVESVTLFEIQNSDADGWQEITPGPSYLLRRGCVISLLARLGNRRQLARVTYTGGYVLPGDDVKPGQISLPEDIQEACVEQLACWYANRTQLGLVSVTSDGQTTAYAQQELLPAVQSTLQRYVRYLA